MSTPTREELGLPWTETDGWLKIQGLPEVAPQISMQPLQFAIHAANTYHEREQLLRECLELFEYGYVKDKAILDRLRTALTPPQPLKSK